MTDAENKNIHQNNEDNDNRSKNNKNINKKNINDKAKSNKGFFFSHGNNYQKLSLVQRGLFTECRSLRKIKKSTY